MTEIGKTSRKGACLEWDRFLETSWNLSYPNNGRRGNIEETCMSCMGYYFGTHPEIWAPQIMDSGKTSRKGACLAWDHFLGDILKSELPKLWTQGKHRGKVHVLHGIVFWETSWHLSYTSDRRREHIEEMCMSCMGSFFGINILKYDFAEWWRKVNIEETREFCSGSFFGRHPAIWATRNTHVGGNIEETYVFSMGYFFLADILKSELPELQM